MADDRVSAELAAIRERAAHELEAWRLAPEPSGIHMSAHDVPRLLAAVKALLAMHQQGRVLVRGHLCDRHEAHGYFSITSTEQADVLACPDCTATVSFSCTGCHASVSVDSCPVRAAIERALTGEDGPEARKPPDNWTDSLLGPEAWARKYGSQGTPPVAGEDGSDD